MHLYFINTCPLFSFMLYNIVSREATRCLDTNRLLDPSGTDDSKASSISCCSLKSNYIPTADNEAII